MVEQCLTSIERVATSQPRDSGRSRNCDDALHVESEHILDHGRRGLRCKRGHADDVQRLQRRRWRNLVCWRARVRLTRNSCRNERDREHDGDTGGSHKHLSRGVGAQAVSALRCRSFIS